MSSCAMIKAACAQPRAGGASRKIRRRATKMLGGEGGIRTPDTVTRMPHFECGAFNHSATSPVLITLHFSSVADPVDNAAATQLLPFTARATALCSPCVQRRPAFSDPRVVRLPVACPAAHGNRDPA